MSKRKRKKDIPLRDVDVIPGVLALACVLIWPSITGMIVAVVLGVACGLRMQFRDRRAMKRAHERLKCGHGN